MRLVKFRVWDEVTNTMHFPGEDGTQLVFGITNIYGEEGYHTWQLWDEEGELAREGKAGLMQHTGLKVHNDTELYEDDICEVKGSIHLGWKKGWVRFKRNGVVTYLEDEMKYVFKVYIDDEYGYRNVEFDKGMRQSYKVIGNIYEHPHLLEVKL